MRQATVDQGAGYTLTVVESPWPEASGGGFYIEENDMTHGTFDLWPMWFETRAEAQAFIENEVETHA